MSIKVMSAPRNLTAYYERVVDLSGILPDYELAAWGAWEQENVDGSSLVGSSDWPGLDKYRPYLNLPVRRKRQGISAKIRNAVMERDGFVCQRCGGRYDLTIDHIQPVVVGGDNELANLQALCRPCNLKKGTSL